LLRGLEASAAAILSAFGLSPDPNAPPARAEALALLFEWLPPGMAKREDARRDLEAVRRLHALLGAAARQAEDIRESKGAKPRTPNGPLDTLFEEIAIAYRRATGGRIGRSSNPTSGEACGPLVRFAQEAVRLIALRLPEAVDFGPESDADDKADDKALRLLREHAKNPLADRRARPRSARTQESQESPAARPAAPGRKAAVLSRSFYGLTWCGIATHRPTSQLILPPAFFVRSCRRSP
jgi:hypothetical protein